jgi:hypothetical protein
MGELGGGLKGGQNAQQTQYPSFTSAGGVTPEQTSLADYDYGQTLLTGQSEFGGGDQGGGAGMSTMATQVAGGAETGKALNLAASSDADQDAQYSAYKNAVSIDQQNQGNALTEQTQANTDLSSTLGSLAGLAGGKTTTPTASATT